MGTRLELVKHKTPAALPVFTVTVILLLDDDDEASGAAHSAELICDTTWTRSVKVKFQGRGISKYSFRRAVELVVCCVTEGRH